MSSEDLKSFHTVIGTSSKIYSLPLKLRIRKPFTSSLE